jgi:hypothetical protein
MVGGQNGNHRERRWELNSRSIEKCLAFFLALSVAISALIPLSRSPQLNPYLEAAVEAVRWGLQFYITPPDFGYGIPSHNEKAWGFGQYYYSNGTGSPGGGTWLDEYILIGGHDAGQYGLAALQAYEVTNDPFFLEYFERVFFPHYKKVQAPNPDWGIPEYVQVDGWNCSLRGYFIEQASYKPGSDGVYGTEDDEVTLASAWASAEHGNPIAFALMKYYELTGDEEALRLVEEYANWVIEQIYDEGTDFPGAVGAILAEALANTPPRIFETAESAWFLVELHVLTGKERYLEAAERIGRFMLETQWREDWNRIRIPLPPPQDKRIVGGLPYLWYDTLNSTITNSTLTTYAGFVLMAWTRLYEVTGKTAYLYGVNGSSSDVKGGALAYADWLLSMQVTPGDYEWGDHKYSDDPHAVGGFYYGFMVRDPWVPRMNELDVFQYVWSAAYSIPGLLRLYEITTDSRYLRAARLAGDWLLGLRRDIDGKFPLFTIAGNYSYKDGGFWGLYPQRYMPDDTSIEPIRLFYEAGLLNLESIMKKELSWYEKRFGVDLNLEIWREAGRGEKYMKEMAFSPPLGERYIGSLIWHLMEFSFPDVGFEPRYCSDVALGLFEIGTMAQPQPGVVWMRVEVVVATIVAMAILGLALYRKRVKRGGSGSQLEERNPISGRRKESIKSL